MVLKSLVCLAYVSCSWATSTASKRLLLEEAVAASGVLRGFSEDVSEPISDQMNQVIKL